MSTESRRMSTRATNATQHPGYIQRKPRQPADTKPKSKRAEAKAEKAIAKKLGAARLAKFEQDAMEQENVLDATPRPNFTPTASRTQVPAFETSPLSFPESEGDTDEMNPDKATYNSGPTTEEDTDKEYVVPSSPPKRTYAEVASPPRKSRVATGTKAASGIKAVEPAPERLKAAKSMHAFNSIAKYDSVPLSSLPPATKRKRKTAEARPSDLFHLSTALSLSPKTPAPVKKARHTKNPSPEVETDPDSPRVPKQRALQRHESYLDEGFFDVPTGGDESNAPIGSPASAWREWQAREVGTGMEMDVDPVETSQKQTGRKGKPQHKVAINVDVGTVSLSGGENVRRKGKGKEKLVTIEEGPEDVEMETLTRFVVPALPAQGSARSAAREVASDQNVAGASNNSEKRKFEGSVVSKWARSIPAKAASRASSHASSIGKQSIRSTVPSLTNQSTITGTSVHTSDIQRPQIRIKPTPKDHYHSDNVATVLDDDQLYAQDIAISDREETQGEEHDEAVKSPPKGSGVRLGSEHWIREKPTITSMSHPNQTTSLTAPSAKRARSRSRAPLSQAPLPPTAAVSTLASSEAHTGGNVTNNRLPPGTDLRLWRRGFIPTFIQFMARQANPWAISPRQAVLAMQTIWDALFGDLPQTITTASVTYRLAMQRVADSWRSPIGSTGIAVLIAFFQAHSDLYPTDSDRQAWAAWYLDKFRFVYKQADGNDKSKFRGMLRGPLVLQTFGAHWTAVAGARKIDGLDDPNLPVGKPIGGLGLAAAAVERALTLVREKIITITSIDAAQGKCPTLTKSEDSSVTVAFNDDGWGDISRSFTKSAAKVAQAIRQFEKIENAAKEFSRGTTRVTESVIITSAPQDSADNDDARANLIAYDSDENDTDEE